MLTILINQMLRLFLMIFIGYVLYKINIMDAELNKKLTRLILDVTLPAMVIASVMNPEGERDYKTIGFVILVSFLIYVFLTVFSFLLIKLLHFPKEQQGLYIFMHIFSNIAFMGFPIINAMYGKSALLYNGILTIFFNLTAYSIGPMIITYKGGKLQADKEHAISGKDLLNPGVLSGLLAIGIYFLPVTFPSVVTGVFDSIGGLTSPLAMLLIGGSLAKVPLKEVVSDWRVYFFTVVKQIAIPLLLWPILKVAIADEFIRTILFILILMPVANTAVLFATRYDQDEKLAAKNIFVTTVISLVTIPLCLYLVGI